MSIYTVLQRIIKLYEHKSCLKMKATIFHITMIVLKMMTFERKNKYTETRRCGAKLIRTIYHLTLKISKLCKYRNIGTLKGLSS